MFQQLLPGLRMTLIFTLLTGLIYPLATTGLCQFLFPRQANGSLIAMDGRVIGSELLGQNFTSARYFQPRPSGAGDGYDAANSGSPNLGPTNPKLAERVKGAVEKFRKENPDFHGPIPADLLTTSASGLDPDISPASAEAQAARVSKARGMSIDRVRSLIASHIQNRVLGFLGEPRVNVLRLNLDLDRSASAATPPARADGRSPHTAASR